MSGKCTKALIKKFEEKFVIEISGCWRWIAATMGKGYGYFRVGAKLHGAHRVAYELYKGPIGNKHVLHTCDNPWCVNPEHLFLGTNKENVLDMMAKGRAYDVPTEKRKEIKLLYKKGGYTQKELGKKFNCSQATVQRIVNCEKL